MIGIAKKNYSEWTFLLLQAFLYVSFLTIDITGGNIRISMGIKYTMIILCFCYALFAKGAYKSIIFLQAGLFFTLISDLFILILDYYIYGVFTFILVQQLYGLRLIILQYERQDETVTEKTKGRKDQVIALYRNRLIFQIGLAVIIYLVLHLAGVILESLLIASVFYFISILLNTITAIGLAAEDGKEKSNVLFAVGMLLFLLCDINVGLFNMTGFIAMPQDIYAVIYSVSSILMWTFYAPSQVMIAISCHYIRK